MKGAYLLHIKIPKKLELEIGKLGKLAFAPGKYIYVGSAMTGLEARTKRHLGTAHGEAEKIFWHIDHLLTNSNVKLTNVELLPSNEKEECEIARELAKQSHCIAGFGASDCKCKGHLFKI